MVEGLYTLKEVREITGFSMSYLYKIVERGLISYSRPTEGKIFIHPRDLYAFLTRNHHRCAADIVDDYHRRTNQKN